METLSNNCALWAEGLLSGCTDTYAQKMPQKSGGSKG
jgi:hypothetical protein